LSTRSFVVVGFFLLVSGVPRAAATAQSPVQLDIIVPAGTLAATQTPSIVGKNLLADPTTREVLRQGFLMKIH